VAQGVRRVSAFLYTVAGIVFGGIVSAVISYVFAQRASRELREEADALRHETEDVWHYVNALISYLEAAGEIEVRRDDAGRPIETHIIRASAAIIGTSGMIATPTVEHVDHPEDEGGS
jgi:YD repeat-containing protein